MPPLTTHPKMKIDPASVAVLVQAESA